MAPLKHKGQKTSNSAVAAGVRVVFALLVLILIAGIIQLATLRQVEEQGDDHISGRRSLEENANVEVDEEATPGLPWQDDEHAKDLRVGFLKPEVISWKPRVVLFHGFLSDEEADYVVALGRPRMEQSTVVDQETGQGVLSKVRTSSGMFMNYDDQKDPVIARIEKRIAHYSMVPFENGELLQVLRYEVNQFYIPHHDWFDDQFNLKRGGQRVATMLMYLTDNVTGGETYFPDVENPTDCMCGGELKKGICVQPTKGNAVLFWSVKLDGKTDDLSLHGGCKVLSGEKWSSTKWMRESVFT